MNVSVEHKTRQEIIKVIVRSTCRHCKRIYLWDSYYYQLTGNKFNNGLGTHDVGLCQTCKFWLDNFWEDMHGRDFVIINGHHYTIGNRIDGVKFSFTDTISMIKNKLKSMIRGIGMGGEPRIIYKIDDSKEIIITTDLWHQGKIPESFSKYPLFKNNAMFVDL